MKYYISSILRIYSQVLRFLLPIAGLLVFHKNDGTTKMRKENVGTLVLQNEESLASNWNQRSRFTASQTSCLAMQGSLACARANKTSSILISTVMTSLRLRGMVACVKHAARVMVEGGVKGSIVCTGSVVWRQQAVAKRLSTTSCRNQLWRASSGR